MSIPGGSVPSRGHQPIGSDGDRSARSIPILNSRKSTRARAMAPDFGAGLPSESSAKRVRSEDSGRPRGTCCGSRAIGHGRLIMIVLIDNYDSFTYNLVQRLGEIDPSLDLRVVRNDQVTLD
jgi:hypothetical protein